MYLVEWCYGLGSALRSKLCNADECVFWVEAAKSGGASMIVVSQVGVC